ncbi:hypothetical protein PL18_10475 [Vibrio renipiscarius]|uniref:Uncharacterized protein n=1 Tax=Vibrio renipiscarius TaxID=1461322 RepID=A0A0C2NRB0_9VIBR|nr:hypothetical protein OJ16_18365 [Vibrio renipiscarius]KII78720.1 hypothetical protein PL18_10475 [Vibrio renipiscarius]
MKRIRPFHSSSLIRYELIIGVDHRLTATFTATVRGWRTKPPQSTDLLTIKKADSMATGLEAFTRFYAINLYDRIQLADD